VSGVAGLQFPDVHHLRAAEGWLALGAHAEAAAELRKLTPAGQGHPDVLELRWQLKANQQRWEAALEVARLLIQADSERATGWIYQSYALHELRRTDEAWDTLLPVFERFPQNGTIPYNLGCYACQLGDLGVAREWIQRAIKIRGKEEIQAMAVDDSDLKPLMPWLATL